MEEQKLVDDIFNSDDDEQPTTTASSSNARAAAPKAGTLSGLFDSDDEDNAAPAPKRAPVNTDGLFDSDDDSDNSAPVVKKRLGNKKRRLDKSRNLADSDEEGEKPTVKRSKLKSKKREQREKRRRLEEANNRPKKEKVEGQESGDEYDSGGEPERTKEDDEFLSEDDDHDDIMKEYDEDNQNFDDERPRNFKKMSSSKAKSSSAKASSASGSGSGSSKTDDPLSQVLKEMKAQKVKEWTDTEKQSFADRLQYRMRDAARRDEAVIVRNAQGGKISPATHKLELLPAVQQALSINFLWETMLDRDILQTLALWLMPRADNTLPSLPIRTAIYQILLRLPCQSDHLKKRSMIDDIPVPPIGHVIVQLRKHKLETDENKRTLKEIMDKWSRDIFSKAVDVTASLGAFRNDQDVHAALAAKYAASQQQHLTAAEEANFKKETYLRARAPMILGHMFTVKPETSTDLAKRAGGGDKGSKDDDKDGEGGKNKGNSGIMREKMDDSQMVGSRTALLKKTEIGGRGGAASNGMGNISHTQKTKIRAVTVSIARPTASNF